VEYIQELENCNLLKCAAISRMKTLRVFLLSMGEAILTQYRPGMPFGIRKKNILEDFLVQKAIVKNF